METCIKCGASLADGDEHCPACGEIAARGAEVLTLRPDSDRAPGAGGEDEEPTSVPAGTWASTSEIEGLAQRPEPDTRRFRKLPREESGEVASPREPLRQQRRVRVDAAARGRARGLAIAAAAAEESERASDEQAKPQARVVAFPAAPRTADSSATDPSSASSSGMRAQSGAGVAPPQWLASELLRERPPAEPFAWTSRALAVAGGSAIVASAVTLDSAAGVHLGIAALGAAIGMAAALPLRFAMRSAAFALLASIGLVLATAARTGGGPGTEGLATMGTTLLAAAQLLRALHRGSRFARAAMGVGVVVSASWLVVGSGLEAMVVRDAELSAWIGPGVRALLLIVLALSLLGFVDDASDSGCRFWPWLVLGWSAVDGIAAVAAGSTASAVGAATTPLFAAIAAVGWMQVWALTPGLGREAGRVRGDG